MFSVFSRLGKPGDGKKTTPAPMSSSLQKKFSKGVHYNMKILIKGDRNVGKSCLLQRLQGGPFIEEYRPTDQIQVAPINWTYKDTEHIVKVEVWEVVDKAQAKKKGNQGLKLENAAPNSQPDVPETPQLDATFLNVYKNANGVILMLDITKPWTFDYVQRELAGIPSDIPVIILGNHCDMHHHRQVHPHQIEYIMESQHRSGSVRYAEASMRNGFGLRLLHRFLSVPFLQLQRTTLLAQLSTNQQDTEQCHRELDQFQNSEEADYNSFLERLATRRKQEGTSGVGSGGASKPFDRSPSIVLGGGKPIIPPNVNPLANSSVGVSPNKSYLGTLHSSMTEAAGAPVQPLPKEKTPPTLEVPPLVSNKIPQSLPVPLPSTPKSATNLDDFCAGDLDHSFLDDLSPTAKSQPTAEYVPNYSNKLNLDSESEEEIGANPLVVKIQEDPDSDVEIHIGDAPRQSPPLKFSSGKENVTRNVSKTAKVLQLNPDPPINAPISTYISSENVFTPFSDKFVQSPVDLIEAKSDFGTIESKSETNIFGRMSMDKLSLYSADKNTPSDEETYDSGHEFNNSNVYMASSVWPIDTSIRRSPEGGEDVEPDAEVKKEKKSKDEKRHKKSKKSKDKERSHGDKEKRREKDKERDSEKAKKKKDKKLKKKDSDDYLEEFLNGTSSAVEPAQEAYDIL